MPGWQMRHHFSKPIMTFLTAPIQVPHNFVIHMYAQAACGTDM